MKERDERRREAIKTFVATSNVQPTVPMETLKAFGDVYQAAKVLMVADHERESLPLSKLLYELLLRLVWAKVSGGKPNTAAAPDKIPFKLFNRGVIDKQSLRQMTKVLGSGERTREYLACCSALMDWLAK